MKEIFVFNSKLAESGGYIFGAGYNGKRLYEFLDAHIKIHGFIDMDEGKINTTFCGGSSKVFNNALNAVLVSI